MNEPFVLSFPHMGDYSVPLAAFLRRVYPNATILPAPPITRKTAALGAAHSPDFICEPFKYNIGNFIEALDQGATVLFQTGTGCRYGYYGELQEQILRDLGYSFTFVCLSRENVRPIRAYRMLKRLGSPLGFLRMFSACLLATQSIRAMDRLADYARRQAAGACDPDEMRRIYQAFLAELGDVRSFLGVWRLRRVFGKRLRAVPRNRPAAPLIRVGVVGDLYTVMEPFSNFDIERKLMARGVSVFRRMSVWFLLFGPPKRWVLLGIRKYVRFHIGANGTDSIAQSLRYAKKQFDGVLHVKSFGCAPELNATPAMMQISQEHNLPILHLSFDTHTSETGLETRIEAFLDMLEERRRAHDAHTQPGRRHRVDFDEGRFAR